MATNIGPKIGIDGEAEYRKQINLIIQQAKTLASEMKLVTTEYTKNTDAEVKAARQSEIMQKQLETQRDRVKALSDMLEKSKQETGENSIETAKWQEVVNKATAELNKMENELDEGADATEDLSDAMEDAEDSTFSFGDALKSNLLAQAIVDGVKRIASEIKNLAGDMIDAAASVKAETSQFEQTFGSFGDAASEAIGRVADASGILDTRLNAVGTQIYAFARSSGGSATESLDLMERALQAAADGAAYYDRSLEETAEQLQSFLKGNYANDAALGLSATETTRNAAAMELYGKKFAELTEIQKEETLLQMVLDAQKLSGAMGQAAREADGWENVQGNLNEAWRQFEAKAGAPFLEALVPIIQQITEGLIEWTESIDWDAFSASISNFVTQIKENGPMIVSVIAGIGAGFVAWNVVSLISGVVTAIQAFQKANEGATIAQAALNLVMQANPIGIVIAAITALVAWLVTLFATNEDFRNSCIEVWTAVKDFVALAVDSMIAFGTKLKDTLVLFFTQTIPNAFNAFKAKAQSIFQSVAQFFTNLAQSIKTGAVNIGTSIIDGIQRAVQFITSLPGQALSWGRDFIQGFINGITSAMSSLVSTVSSLAGKVRSYLHFSRPDTGPLRDYETWMPDFVKGMAAGMRDNAYRLADAGEYLAGEIEITPPDGWDPYGGNPSGRGYPSGGTSLGGIVVNVYGAPGQDVDELAEAVADKIETKYQQLAGVW